MLIYYSQIGLNDTSNIFQNTPKHKVYRNKKSKRKNNSYNWIADYQFTNKNNFISRPYIDQNNIYLLDEDKLICIYDDGSKDVLINNIQNSKNIYSFVRSQRHLYLFVESQVFQINISDETCDKSGLKPNEFHKINIDYFIKNAYPHVINNCIYLINYDSGIVIFDLESQSFSCLNPHYKGVSHNNELFFNYEGQMYAILMNKIVKFNKDEIIDFYELGIYPTKTYYKNGKLFVTNGNFIKVINITTGSPIVELEQSYYENIVDLNDYGFVTDSIVINQYLFIPYDNLYKVTTFNCDNIKICMEKFFLINNNELCLSTINHKKIVLRNNVEDNRMKIFIDNEHLIIYIDNSFNIYKLN